MCVMVESGRRPPVRLALVLALAALLLGPAARPAAADPYQWLPPAGLFGDPGSWLPPGPPGAFDDALFLPPAESCQVLFDSSYANNQLVVEANVSFELAGFLYLLTQEWDELTLTGGVVVAQTPGSAGTLTLVNGYISARDLDIAHGVGTTGMVVVGVGAQCAVDNTITIGRSGNGSLTIQDGGTVEHGVGFAGMDSGSQGTLTVTGLGSECSLINGYRLGWEGQGYLNVTGQGVATMGDCGLGMLEGSYGEAVIDGAGSLWHLLYAGGLSLLIGQRGTAVVTATHEGTIVNAGSLHLGGEAAGDGQLTVEAGGRVAVGRQLVAGAAGSGRVDVTGKNSQLTVSGDEAGDGIGLKIGDGGIGHVHVLDGGYVTVIGYAAIVGCSGGSPTVPSTLVVNGADSLFEGPTTLQVGAGAYGKAVATGGGILRAGAVNSVCSIGVFAPGEVTATAGGTFEYGWQVFVGDQNIGTLDVTDGGHYSAHSTVVGTSTGSDGTLTVRGPGSTMTHLSFLGVGWRGLGTAYFEDLCTADLGGSLIVGGATGGPGGKAYIRDGAAVTSATQARIGDYCSGELYLTGGGTFTSNKGTSASGSSGIIGRDTAGDGFVSVSDNLSCWTQDGALTVGWLGQGHMEVLNGARVSCVDGLVGRSAGSNGYVLVSGAAALWAITGSAAVGGSLTDPGGQGYLEVSDDGGVEAGDTLRVWPTGALTVDGGTVTAGGLAGPVGARVYLRDPAGGTALTVGGSTSAEFFGDLHDSPGGSGSLKKVGTGTQTLAGSDITYTGATTVLEGLLRLSDTTAFASNILNSATTEFAATTGTWTFAGAIGGAGAFTKSGAGTLVIAGPQDYAPGALFDVLGGAAVLNTDASGTGLMADAHLAMSVTGAELRFGASQHLDTLTVNGGGKVVFAGADCGVLKHLANVGTIDLATAALVVDYEAGSSPLAAVRAMLASGYAGGLWNGPGIHSSAAAADPDDLTAVGVLDNTDPKVGGKTTFEGEPVDATAVLVKYTWGGDANLDGLIDANDYDVIDKNYLFTPDPDNMGWWTGDFTYDGVIDANDYDRIDRAFLFQTGPLGTSTPFPTPEPATLALLALGAAAALRHRRA